MAHLGGIEFYFPILLVVVFRVVFLAARGTAETPDRNRRARARAPRR
jgi:hypothetical protein